MQPYLAKSQFLFCIDPQFKSRPKMRNQADIAKMVKQKNSVSMKNKVENEKFPSP